MALASNRARTTNAPNSSPIKPHRRQDASADPGQRRARGDHGNYMKLFVIMSRYVDAEKVRANRDAHVALIQDLHDRHWAIASGPFVDGSGGTIVIRAPDRAAVDAVFFARDPFTASNAAEYTVVEFSPAEFPRRSQALDRFLSQPPQAP